MAKEVKIARIFGIDITLHYSWFFIALLLSYGLAIGYFPQHFPGLTRLQYGVIGILSAVLLFVCVLLHELSHSLVAKHYKIPIDKIQLFFFGGIAHMREDNIKPQTEFLMAIAGPIFSLCLAVLFFNIQPFITSIYMAPVIHYLARINLVLGIFNLVPGFPLDGGRALRALIWMYTKNYEKATYIASRGGKFFGFALIFLGFINILFGNFGGLWFILIGGFLYFLAEMSFEQAIMKKSLEHVFVKDVMQKRFKKLTPTQEIDDVIQDYFLKFRKPGFPVFKKNKFIGLLTLQAVRQIPLHERHKAKVQDAYIPARRFPKVKESDNLYKILVKLFKSSEDIFPVIKQKKLVGLLSRERVLAFIKTKISLKA